jgi:hypothetical protein
MRRSARKPFPLIAKYPLFHPGLDYTQLNRDILSKEFTGFDGPVVSYNPAGLLSQR